MLLTYQQFQTWSTQSEILEVISDIFNIVRLCTGANYAQKLIIK